VASQYDPGVRYTLEISPEDVDHIRFYSTTHLFVLGSSVQKAKKAWDAEWAARTHGLSSLHLRCLEMRGLDLRLAHPPEGSDEWRRIVYGPSKAEYEEIDRVGSLAWYESYQANEKRARLLSATFLALSYDEQITCARFYRNAAAWGVFEGLLSEEDKKAIYKEAAYLDRLEDELLRRDDERDD